MRPEESLDDVSAEDVRLPDVRSHVPCAHTVTTTVGPALRRCVTCGAVVERIPEPTGCEGASCES